MTGNADQSFLAGGGEMGERSRAMDWSSTPVGVPSEWPQSLKTAVSICLGSRYPIVVWWGNPAYTMFYNDGYIPILGVTKHPGWLGRSGQECWSDIWHIVGPMLEGVFASGQATWSENLLLVMRRNVPHEECYFTFSYSPIRDDSGTVPGIFCACYETTGQVIGERRLKTLRDLSRAGVEAKTAEKACEVASSTLGENPADIPFALIYLLEADGGHARLVATTAVEAGAPAAPGRIELKEPDTSSTWPLRAALDSAAPVLVSDVPAKFGPLPGGPWPESPEAALIVPIAAPGQPGPTGFLVAGLSPRRVIDADYRSFLDLVAGHIGTSIANARAYEEERKRAEALAEIDRAKTAFFSNVSHEFRTPLTLMMGPLEDALAQSDGLAGADRERLELAHRNSLRLLKLVNTLLDFSRIEAGRIEASYEPIDLAVFTTELASVFRSAIERAGLRLVVDCKPLSEPVYVDREMWEKIVLNLISNAFKFTFEGEIEVLLRQAGDAVELTVRDTGTGIPAEEISRLFERFHRVKGARGRSYEGSGIGLALVQELLKLHGGSARVESEVGAGSRFIVSIPLGKAHLPANRIEAERTLASTGLRSEAYVAEVLRWLPDAPQADSTPQRASAERILLADDNVDMREYVRRLLTGAGYEVDAAADGLAALRAARECKPDLVLTDIMMPGLDGFGLLRELRADPELGGIPIIMLSARAGEEARIEGLRASADDYLIKPFSARELLARVESHLKMARLRKDATEALRHRTEQFETLLNQAPLGVYVVDGDFRIRLVNSKARPAFDDIPGEIIGRDFDEIMHIMRDENYADQIVRVFRRTLETGEPNITPEQASHRVDRGTTEYYEWRLDRILLPEGRFGVVCYFHDISEQVRARRAIVESEERFRTLADSAPALIWVNDLGGCEFVNQEYLEFVGVGIADLQGYAWARFVHPEDRDEYIAAYQRAFEELAPFEAEVRMRRYDGEYRSMESVGRPRLGPNGELLGYAGLTIDITQRKQAEATRQLLLSELNHRVKNTLASVQAIVQQTLRSTKDPADFATRFSGRIQSLARVHSLLTDTTWQGADLRELIRDQLLQGAVDETRLTAWGPSVHLGAETAVHLALMLHELGTNSTKYGALAAPGGWVTINWSVTDNALKLRWAERGGPAVSAPLTRGFGTTLIEQSAKSEGGSAQMLCEKEGITWDMVLPLPQTPAPRVFRSPEPEAAGAQLRTPDGGVTAKPRAILAGRRFLVVEDEPIIALDLASSLQRLGADVPRPVGTEAEALHIIEHEDFDGALVDANLHGRSVDAIVAALTRRSIPFVFVTGYRREALPSSFRHAAVLAKPFSEQQLFQTVMGLAQRTSNVVQLKS